MLGIFKRKRKKELEKNISEIDVVSEPIEVIMNRDEDKCGEVYYRNGYFTYIIMEKLFDDFEGNKHYYWCPAKTSVSFFNTKEKAIKEIMSVIESEE